MRELVSVVVPIYKVESFLDKCIQSIIDQSYRYLEIILVNDGSPDKSGDICERYAHMDKRVKVIHKSNGGLSSARNVGIDASNGEYICFIDSDDWLDKEFIRLLVENIIKYKADIAVCGFIYEFENKSVKNIFVNKVEIINKREAIRNLYNKNYLTMTVAWNKLYRKSLFNDLRYEEGIINEDENIIHELFYNCSKVLCIESYLYHYRMRANSITKSKYSLKNLDSVYVYENRLSFFKNKDEEDFVNFTLERYFRILLNNCCSIYYSEINDKKVHYKTLISKIDMNMSKFLLLENLSYTSKILIHSYRINRKFGIYMSKLLDLLKNII